MFKWERYYNLAIELNDREEEEYKRAAISRAYYSVYGRTRKHLKDEGFPLSSNNSGHSTLWNACERLKLIELSIQGDRLKRKRVKADYDNEISNINNLANRSVVEAKKIHEFLDEKEK